MTRLRSSLLLLALLTATACTTTATKPDDPLDAGEWRTTKSRMYQDLARQCLKAKDHDRARALLQQAVQFDPKDTNSLELLCRLAYAYGDHEAARGAALLLAAQQPTSVAAACTLGAIAEANDRPDEAEAHYRAAMTHGPDDVRPRIDLHRLLLARGREAEAEGLRAELARRFPNATEPALDHGAWLAFAGRWSDAGTAFDQALARTPADPAAATGLALCTVLSDQPDRALELGRSLPPRARADNPPLALLLATAHLRAGDRQQALRELELSLPARGDQGQLQLLRGELLAAQGHAEAALAAFEQALAQAPGLARAHAGLGRLHLAGGRCHAAVRAFERASQLQPDSAVHHALLAAALLGAGDSGRAARHAAIAQQDATAADLVAELRRLGVVPAATATPAPGGGRR